MHLHNEIVCKRFLVAGLLSFSVCFCTISSPPLVAFVCREAGSVLKNHGKLITRTFLVLWCGNLDQYLRISKGDFSTWPSNLDQNYLVFDHCQRTTLTIAMDGIFKPVPFRGQSDNLASLADPSMLEKIDKLFACRIVQNDPLSILF
jgi:hypothetical protein